MEKRWNILIESFEVDWAHKQTFRAELGHTCSAGATPAPSKAFVTTPHRNRSDAAQGLQQTHGRCSKSVIAERIHLCMDACIRACAHTCLPAHPTHLHKSLHSRTHEYAYTPMLIHAHSRSFTGVEEDGRLKGGGTSAVTRMESSALEDTVDVHETRFLHKASFGNAVHVMHHSISSAGPCYGCDPIITHTCARTTCKVQVFVSKLLKWMDCLQVAVHQRGR